MGTTAHCKRGHGPVSEKQHSLTEESRISFQKAQSYTSRVQKSFFSDKFSADFIYRYKLAADIIISDKIQENVISSDKNLDNVIVELQQIFLLNCSVHY